MGTWTAIGADGTTDNDRLKALLDANPDLSVDDAAAHFPDKKLDGLSRQIRRLRPHETLIAPGRAKDERNKTVVRANNFLVLSDLHAPFHHAPFLNQVIELARAWKIDIAVVNGDLFDHSAFKTYPGREHDPSYEAELSAVEQIFGVLDRYFTRIYVTMGNHDERLVLRLLNSALSHARWVRMWTDSPNVHVLKYPFIKVHGSTKKWVCGHPDRYSREPAKKPATIQLHRFPGYNVIGAHTHHVGSRFVVNELGQFIAMDSGCCCNPDLIEYVQGFSDLPNMVVGAVIVKNEKAYQLTLDTDFAEMKLMYQK